ncbi:MAG TPA: TraB/GumN family protein [Candidatus Udaeobacter sp.]|nr:TraB/GumN family protein [Candidatus Udaeobacter sp.]
MFCPVRRTAGGFIALFVAFALMPHPTEAAPQNTRFPKCCVWRVTNAKAPFYLVGSIHALSRKDYPLPKPYEIALNNSHRFVFEFDPTRGSEFQRKFEAAAKYPRGQDLRSKISPELLAWLRKNMFTIIPEGRGGKGEQLGSFDSQLHYKPWWIAQHLAAPAAYSKTSASHGLDNYFVDNALRTGKEIGGLESVTEHVAVMGGLSDRDGEFILQDALSQPDNGEKEFSRMYKAWRKGDTSALWAGDAHLRTKAPKIAARFVDDRNVKWIPRIEAELKAGKPTAIVAGALHFSGPHSVVALLQERGYKIEQL